MRKLQRLGKFASEIEREGTHCSVISYAIEVYRNGGKLLRKFIIVYNMVCGVIHQACGSPLIFPLIMNQLKFSFF